MRVIRKQEAADVAGTLLQYNIRALGGCGHFTNIEGTSRKVLGDALFLDQRLGAELVSAPFLALLVPVIALAGLLRDVDALLLVRNFHFHQCHEVLKIQLDDRIWRLNIRHQFSGRRIVGHFFGHAVTVKIRILTGVFRLFWPQEPVQVGA